MRDRGVLVLVLLGVAPLFVFGLPFLASTAASLDDPCTTWGASWDPYQEGGGSSAFGPDGRPEDPACPQGRSWTTEAPGRALLRAATLPAAGLVGLAAGLAARASRRAWPLVAVAPPLLLASFPLGLGATVVVAGLPAACFVGAARVMPATRWERRALIAFGLAVAALFVFTLVGSLVAVATGALPPVALLGAFLGGLQFGAVALLALAPVRA